MNNKKQIFFSFFLLLIVLITYSQLINTFYQQDEWAFFGHALDSNLISSIFSQYHFLEIIGGTGRPLATSITFIFQYFLPFQPMPFLLFAIVMQFLNSMLVFQIARKISHSNFISFIAGVFFATSSVSQQAVTWIAASSSALPSTFFSLLSILFYIYFLKKLQRKYLYLSSLSVLVAYFFRESAIFLVILLPCMYLLYSKKPVSIYRLIKMHGILVLYFSLAIMFRIFSLLFLASYDNTAGFVTRTEFPVVKLIFNIVLHPYISFSQFYIPPTYMWQIADFFGKINYPRVWSTPLASVATETIGASMMSFIFSTILLVVLFGVYIYDKKNRKLIIFSLFFTFSSFLPYLFIDKTNAYLDSRYYYFGAIGAGILFGILLNFLQVVSAKYKIPARLSFLLIGIIAFSYFYLQITTIQDQIKQEVVIASERKSFLAQLDSLQPTIDKKPIFFITGNTDYYIANHKVPFQQGMGYTLMVWYYSSGVISKKLINDGFLWDIQSQGYKEINGKGFGYFWDLDSLRKDINSTLINKNHIYSFYYDAHNKRLINISDKVKNEL